MKVEHLPTDMPKQYDYTAPSLDQVLQSAVLKSDMHGRGFHLEASYCGTILHKWDGVKILGFG